MIARRQVCLTGGVAGVVRPIATSDAHWLEAGLQRLSPESRVRRFLYDKRAYTPAELEHYTTCDASRHIALVFALLDAAGNDVDAVAVARCFRYRRQPEEAEFAIAVLDEWQRRGIGAILVHELAAWAWEIGIRCWHAVFLTTNEPTRKLLNRVADLKAEHWLSADCIDATYALRPPQGRSDEAVSPPATAV